MRSRESTTVSVQLKRLAAAGDCVLHRTSYDCGAIRRSEMKDAASVEKVSIEKGASVIRCARRFDLRGNVARQNPSTTTIRCGSHHFTRLKRL